MRISLFPVLLSLVLCACAEMRIVRNEKPALYTNVTSQTDLKLHSFVLGLVPGKSLLSQNELCDKNHRIDSVRLGMKSTDVLVTLVTFGVYVPYRATINCIK